MKINSLSQPRTRKDSYRFVRDQNSDHKIINPTLYHLAFGHILKLYFLFQLDVQWSDLKKGSI
jgi:hypothetical protein